MTQQIEITPRSISLPEDHTRRLLRAFPEGVIVFDLETTGLSSLCDKIIEVGAIKILPNQEVRQFSTLINPEIEIPKRSTDIHGITNQMVADAPKVDVVMKSFHGFIENYPLVAHNAQFDVGFIIFQFHLHGIEANANPIFCSCQYARKSIKSAQNHKLSTLCKHLDIELENHHRAVDDALATTYLMSHAIKKDIELKFLKRSKIYQLDEFHQIQEQSETHQKIIEISKNEAAAKMIYQGGSMKNTWRPVMPVGLMPTPRGDVLYAHCLVSDLYKSFLVKKITEIENCEESELEQLKEKLK